MLKIKLTSAWSCFPKYISDEIALTLPNFFCASSVLADGSYSGLRREVGLKTETITRDQFPPGLDFAVKKRRSYSAGQFRIAIVYKLSPTVMINEHLRVRCSRHLQKKTKEIEFKMLGLLATTQSSQKLAHIKFSLGNWNTSNENM